MPVKKCLICCACNIVDITQWGGNLKLPVMWLCLVSLHKLGLFFALPIEICSFWFKCVWSLKTHGNKSPVKLSWKLIIIIFAFLSAIGGLDPECLLTHTLTDWLVVNYLVNTCQGDNHLSIAMSPWKYILRNLSAEGKTIGVHWMKVNQKLLV